MDSTVVSVDFFKETGKWYTREEVAVPALLEGLFPREFLVKRLNEQLSDAGYPYLRYNGMIAVCTDFPDAPPLMIFIPKEGRIEER